MNVTIFGATGMVGIEVLHQCLEHHQVGRVVTVGRNRTGVTHDKLIEVDHHDFTDYSPLEAHLSETAICLYCLGVYQGTVSTATFWEVTCTYLKALIEALERTNTDMTFCLSSAQGADPRERSPFLFAKAKGRAERVLLESRIQRKYAFRPGYIRPGRKTSKSRVPDWLVRPFYRLVPAIGIDAADLARVMVHVGVNGFDHAVLHNGEMRHLAASIRGRSPS